MLTDRALLLIMAACAGVAFVAVCIAVYAISVAVTQLDRVEAQDVKFRLLQLEEKLAEVNPAAFAARLNKAETALMEVSSDFQMDRFRGHVGALEERVAALESRVRQVADRVETTARDRQTVSDSTGDLAARLASVEDGLRALHGRDGLAAEKTEAPGQTIGREEFDDVAARQGSLEEFVAELAVDIAAAANRMPDIEHELASIATEKQIEDLRIKTGNTGQQLEKLTERFHTAVVDLASHQTDLQGEVDAMHTRMSNFGRIIRQLRLASHKKGIQVVSGTYGGNCPDTDVGNATPFLASACNDKEDCIYIVDMHVLGDPAPGCEKNFLAEWYCGDGKKPHTAALEAEAGTRKALSLHCP